jgi:hypothetical protein
MPAHQPWVYEKFDPARMKEYSQIPEATLNYWGEAKKRGNVPLLFQHIPHILYRGILDISQLPIVNGLPHSLE